MDLAHILALYDHDEREIMTEPGMRREEAPGVVRHVDLVGRESVIIYARIPPERLEATITAQTVFFDPLGHTLEWKLYAHDWPEELADRLVTHGFAPDEQEAIMVLDLDAAPQVLLDSPSASIRRLKDPKELDDVRAINQAVWSEDRAARIERLAFQMHADPEYQCIYVAYVDGIPTATARITFAPGSRFAGLWGGSTVPVYRERGLYTALTAARVQEARRRGVRYATVDAGPMSRPILEKLGFVPLALARAYVRRAPGTENEVEPSGSEAG